MSQVVDFVFNNLSRIGQDDYNYTQENVMNKSQLNYFTTNYRDMNDVNAINLASSHPTMNMKGGSQVGPNGNNVNESSNLINSKMTNLNFKINLQERTYKTVPYLGRGNVDVGLENKLKLGDTLKEKKTNVKFGEECQFDVKSYPLNKELKTSLTDCNKLIEESAVEGWIRGGLPSREIYKDSKYECN
tara:strand:+ start:35039 stop:35602 length:564 start_codon:yes stop_codon:yes gene_type:complete